MTSKTRLVRLEEAMQLRAPEPIKLFVTFIEPVNGEVTGAYLWEHGMERPGRLFDRGADESFDAFRSRAYLAVGWDPGEPDRVCGGKEAA